MSYRFLLALCLAPCLAACSDDASSSIDPAPIERYAEIARTAYRDSLDQAVVLKERIAELTLDPSEQRLQGARQAWVAAREPYLQTEVYRFYDGPIDNPETGPEGRINAWPLDENHIDYTVDDASAGIINDVSGFPELSKELLSEQNERGGEKNIASGYHAIEFLLWGQDLDDEGPGARPFTDFVAGESGTHENQARRARYLELAADLLTDDLSQVAEAWEPDSASYATEFLTLSGKEALKLILTGMGSLSGAELAGERMLPAYDNQDQEDEHSCFSDTTDRDMYLDALGVQNVYLGRYAGEDGPGIDELVRARDAELAERLTSEMKASLDAISKLPKPFDRAIQDEAGRAQLLKAVRALQTQAGSLAEAAALFDIRLNLE